MPHSVRSTSSSFVGTISQIMLGVIDRCSICDCHLCVLQERKPPRCSGPTSEQCREDSRHAAREQVQSDLIDAFLYLLTLSSRLTHSTLFVQCDWHQLAAPSCSAEEEIPPPGLQRHRILPESSRTVPVFVSCLHRGNQLPIHTTFCCLNTIMAN